MQKQFRSTINLKGLLTKLGSFLYTGSLDRLLTTDPAGGIGPGENSDAGPAVAQRQLTSEAPTQRL